MWDMADYHVDEVELPSIRFLWYMIKRFYQTSPNTCLNISSSHPQEEREKEAKKRKLEGDVKKTRDDRVDSWRSFVNAKKPKTEGPEKKKIPVGGLRPPQVKTEDVDRSYVQRVVKKGEDAW